MEWILLAVKGEKTKGVHNVVVSFVPVALFYGTLYLTDLISFSHTLEDPKQPTN